MRYINFQASCYTSKWSYWIEFYDVYVAYCNMPSFESYYWISLNQVKTVKPFDVVLRMIIKFFVKTDCKFRFLMYFSYNIARIWLQKIPKLVGNLWFAGEIRIFAIWMLEKSTEHNWALFQHYFLTNSTMIFRLKIVSEPGNAWQC